MSTQVIDFFMRSQQVSKEATVSFWAILASYLYYIYTSDVPGADREVIA